MPLWSALVVGVHDQLGSQLHPGGWSRRRENPGPVRVVWGWGYYLTRSTWQSGVIGCGWTVIGLAGLVLYLLGGGHFWFFSIGWLVFGGIYLASTAARYQREHSRNDSHTVD
jgi:hypothetical protein